MKVLLQTLILLGAFSLTHNSIAATQDEDNYRILFSASNQIENDDLMNLYRFQNIQIAKVKFTGKGLWGKDFKLLVQEVIDGRPQKKQAIFDSKEDEFFKLKEQEFTFTVLAQRTMNNRVRFDFRFLGYGFTKEFSVKAEQQDFVLKSAQDDEDEIEVKTGREFNFLSFIMPYKSRQGSYRYSDFDPLSVRPDAMGKKFGIPRYFLMQIEFN
jgi:hypothetical protein